ncbi:MAG: ATP-binding protein [Acidobacteriota bacterium]|jgi:predicted AAA+ superfamily ATPase|nr:ATP-binding protein [Acidobacteriota bacterium]
MAEERKNPYIARKEYLDWIISFKDDQIIKVITGIRRSGKSTLLFDIYADYLLENGAAGEQIIKVDLEPMEARPLYDPDVLYRHITGRLQSGRMNYVFIDEAQNCEGYERVVDSFYVKKNVDVYITGSNAYMYSGELATLLSGRYVEIEMLPLSFKEMVKAVKKPGETLPQKYLEYVKFGGFPKIADYNGDSRKINAYLDGIYNTIFKKDIIQRNKITNVPMFEAVMRFVLANIGSQISAKSISDYLNSSKRKTYPQAVDDFLKCLVESYVVYKAERYDVKSREILKSLGKYYVTDIGLRNYLLGFREMDTGHVLENIIYLELLRRGYKVFVGKVDDREVDFVAQKQDDILYVQVAETLNGEGGRAETLKRELAPFRAIKDYNQRLLLTMDYDPNTSYDGIRHLNALDFLMSD